MITLTTHRCPDDWVALGHGCFYFGTDNRSFDLTYLTCHYKGFDGWGGKIAEPADSLMQGLLTAYIATLDLEPG